MKTPDSSFSNRKSLETSELSSHLDSSIEGAVPIVACIGTHKNFKDSPKESSDDPPHVDDSFELRDNITNIEFKKGQTVSELDGSNKFSKKFSRCLGLVVAGIDKKTRKNISFVAHQDPRTVIADHEHRVSSLQQLLKDIKERCVTDTIDAVVVGGRDSLYDVIFSYPELVKSLGGKVQKVLGFEPVVVNGPKDGDQEIPRRRVHDDTCYDSIYYNNNERKLYFLRPEGEVNPSIGSFRTGDIPDFTPKPPATTEFE